MPSFYDYAAAAVHAAGLLVAVVMGGRLLGYAGDRRPGRRAVHLFSASWMALYVASILFHATPAGTLRQIFAAADNGAIFVLIAASYTPYAPLKLSGRGEAGLMAAIWVPAVIGLGCEIACALSGQRRWFEQIAYVLYLVQGAAPLVLYGRTLFPRLSWASILYLAANTAMFSIGLVFYLHPEAPWNHVVWHAIIVAGYLISYGGVRQLLVEESPRR